jgi:hypothetical protein
VLALAATASDTLVVVAYGAFNVANTYTQAQSDARYPLNTSSLFAGKNKILNSDFSTWQRGTSISNFGFFTLYTADRWAFLSVNSGRTISRQVTGDTTNLPFIQYCARVQRDSGNTDTTFLQLSQSFETINAIPFAGKTVTYSFYARKGANFSATSNILLARLTTGTGTDQNVITGYTGGIDTDTNFTITSTWQRFSVTLAVPTTATEIATSFRYTPTGTAGAADYYEVTGVQLEAGTVATAFQTATGTIQGELAACQRYYFNYMNNINQTIGVASFFAPTQAETNIQFPVTMRTAPTLTSTTGSGYYGLRRVGQGTTSMLIFNSSATSAMVYAGGFSSLTAGQSDIFYTNNAAASLSFSAEL